MRVGRLEAPGLHADCVTTGVDRIDAVSPALICNGAASLACVLRGQSDLSAGNDSAALIAHDAGEDALAGLCDGRKDGCNDQK